MSDADVERTQIFRFAGYRWVLATVAFTLGACLAVAGGVMTIFLITEYGGWFVKSTRRRSFLALGVFCCVIAIPAYLLAIWSLDRS